MSRASAVRILLTTCLCLTAPGVWAQGSPVVPAGDDFQVNTFTTGTQQWTAVSMDGSDSFLVLWMTSDSDIKPANFVMRARRFVDDAPMGGEIEVNSYTETASHAHVAVARQPSGEFVVAWDSNGVTGTDNSLYGIQGRRFASDGTTALADQFQINTYTPSNQRRADVAAVESTGNFVVVWQSVGSPGNDDTAAIVARRFDSAGNPQGNDFQVNTFTVMAQLYPHVSTRPAGDFLIVWESGRFSAGQDGSAAGIIGRRFNSSGSPISGEFVINTWTTGQQFWPQAVHLDDGSFVVSWHSMDPGTDGDGAAVRLRRYSSFGTPVGDEIAVNTTTAGDQSYSNLARTNDGGFIVVWQSEDTTGNFEIRARRFDADSNPWGDDFRVNTYVTGSQIRPAVDISGTDMVVTWESYGSAGDDNADRSIQIRRFQIPLFADGFESGDTSAWN